MLFIPNPASNVQLVATMFLVYNIFTSLQDVSTDALAVDILKPHEMEKVNSYMFTSKTVGGIIGGAGLGTIIGKIGITGANITPDSNPPSHHAGSIIDEGEARREIIPLG